MTFFRILVILASCYVVMADYRQDALDQHNEFRAIHDAPPMTLSSSLNRDADQYARRLFDMLRCFGRLKHSDRSTRPGVGENLASGWTTARGAEEGRSVEDSVKSWYDEVCDYDFNFHGFQGSLGHFSQLVWKASTELGIGKYTGRNRGRTCTYIVARYKDAGNVNSPDHFRRNVSKGSFRRSYCNRVSDKSVGEAEYFEDSDDGSTQ